MSAANSRAYHQRVEAMYRRYNPEKLERHPEFVAETMAKVVGKEEKLIAQLVKKYGPEPPVTGAPTADSSVADSVPAALHAPPAGAEFTGVSPREASLAPPPREQPTDAPMGRRLDVPMGVPVGGTPESRPVRRGGDSYRADISVARVIPDGVAREPPSREALALHIRSLGELPPHFEWNAADGVLTRTQPRNPEEWKPFAVFGLVLLLFFVFVAVLASGVAREGRSRKAMVVLCWVFGGLAAVMLCCPLYAWLRAPYHKITLRLTAPRWHNGAGGSEVVEPGTAEVHVARPLSCLHCGSCCDVGWRRILLNDVEAVAVGDGTDGDSGSQQPNGFLYLREQNGRETLVAAPNDNFGCGVVDDTDRSILLTTLLAFGAVLVPHRVFAHVTGFGCEGCYGCCGATL